MWLYVVLHAKWRVYAKHCVIPEYVKRHAEGARWACEWAHRGEQTHCCSPFLDADADDTNSIKSKRVRCLIILWCLQWTNACTRARASHLIWLDCESLVCSLLALPKFHKHINWIGREKDRPRNKNNNKTGQRIEHVHCTHHACVGCCDGLRMQRASASLEFYRTDGIFYLLFLFGPFYEYKWMGPKGGGEMVWAAVAAVDGTDCCCNDMSKLNGVQAFILFVSHRNCLHMTMDFWEQRTGKHASKQYCFGQIDVIITIVTICSCFGITACNFIQFSTFLIESFISIRFAAQIIIISIICVASSPKIVIDIQFMRKSEILFIQCLS